MTRVVIVEDDVDVAELFARVLEYAEDVQVVARHTTTDDLYDVDRWTDVDAAVVDVQLRGSAQPGDELAAWLTTSTDVRPVVVTAGGLTPARDAALEALGVVLLLKPCPFPLLLDAIRGDYR